MTTASQYFAASLLASLTKLGLEALVLSPGARSQALAIAAEQLSRAGRLDLKVALDERGAGYFALGRALASGLPVAVLTTSGTAVANLHPAVLEAHHSGVPLLLLTADRPHEIRGLGANQTTAQPGIFADAVRLGLDVPAPEFAAGLQQQRAENELARSAYAVAARAWEAATESAGPGPVHLNLAFREPLAGPAPDANELFLSEAWRLAVAQQATSTELPSGWISQQPVAGRAAALAAASQRETLLSEPDLETVVIAGVQAGPLAAEFAAANRLPLLAEPSSGARFGDSVISNYPLLLREHPALQAAIRRVIVFGRPTLDRAIIRLLREGTAEVLVVDNARSEPFGLSRQAHHLAAPPRFERPSDGHFLEEWRAAEQLTAEQLTAEQQESQQHANNQGTSRAQLVGEVWAATGDGDRLFFGASRLIREADAMLPARRVDVFSNRGLAGIDGNIATVLGLASAAPNGTTRALIGDLTLFHDAGSLALAQDMSSRNVQLVIGNDSGGSIFEGLEMASWLEEAAFDRVFRTPQRVDIAALAKAYGWGYRAVSEAGQLASSLALEGLQILDVTIRR